MRQHLVPAGDAHLAFGGVHLDERLPHILVDLRACVLVFSAPLGLRGVSLLLVAFNAAPVVDGNGDDALDGVHAQ